jgi:hypothetical protein
LEERERIRNEERWKEGSVGRNGRKKGWELEIKKESEATIWYFEIVHTVCHDHKNDLIFASREHQSQILPSGYCGSSL